jgi:hypothetical protein
MTRSLTEMAIRNSPVRAKPYKVFDGQGLYLEIFPNGSKLWRVRWKDSSGGVYEEFWQMTHGGVEKGERARRTATFGAKSG